MIMTAYAKHGKTSKNNSDWKLKVNKDRQTLRRHVQSTQNYSSADILLDNKTRQESKE